MLSLTGKRDPGGGRRTQKWLFAGSLGPSEGLALTLGGPGTSPAGSRPNQALTPSCCVQAGAFATSFRSFVCIKSSLISSE